MATINDQLLSALRIISEAPLQSLLDCHAHYHASQLLSTATQKLKKTIDPTQLRNPVGDLESYLYTRLSTITDLNTVQLDGDRKVEGDPRIDDICSVDGDDKSTDKLLRAHLSSRSFALEFEQWTLDKGQESIVSTIIKDPRQRRGLVPEFIAEKGYRKDVVKRATYRVP